MIEARKLVKEFPGGARAVDGVSFTLEEGKTLALVGPSGCGKTTTLKAINRLIDLTDGDLRVAGRSITEWNPIQLRRNIGYVIQDVGLMPHLTILENVAMAVRIRGMNKQKALEAARDAFNLVGLDYGDFKDRYPHQLSGGQQQRAGVARALAADPKILLMDEPFGALDPLTKKELQDQFLNLQRGLNKTIVIVTHDLNEAFKLGDLVAVMNKGRIEQLGTAEEIVSSPATEFVRSFIEAFPLVYKSAGEQGGREQ